MDKNLILFQNSHKNIVNIIIHIICGCLYLSLIASCFNGYHQRVTWLYSLFVWWLTGDVILAFVIYEILDIITNELIKHKMSTITLLGLAFLFYLLPEMGHIICDEKTVLSTDNFDINEIIMNILTLLPYSVLSISSENIM